MSDYAERMAQRLISDHERYMSRQAREDALLSNDSESRAALADWSCETPLLRGIGMTMPPRKYPHATPRSRSHGAAVMPSTPEQHELVASGQIEDSVLCIAADGTETIRSVREIRSNGRDTKNRAPVSTPAQVVDTARVNHGHDFNN